MSARSTKLAARAWWALLPHIGYYCNGTEMWRCARPTPCTKDAPCRYALSRPQLMAAFGWAYPIRPVAKRGGYQPTAFGPPPTTPPPKRADARDSA